MNKILKVPLDFIWEDFPSRLVISSFFLDYIKKGNYCGKITLSLKKGKRRILIKGYLRGEPYSVMSGLRWEYYFECSEERKRKLIELLNKETSI